MPICINSDMLDLIKAITDLKDLKNQNPAMFFICKLLLFFYVFQQLGFFAILSDSC